MISARHIGVGLLVATAFSAACSCPGPPCTLTPAGLDAGVQLDNSPVTVSFVQLVPSGCEERVEVALVTTEVYDDSNDPVTSSASFSQDPQSGDIAVDVQFESRAPGWYHVRANVEPALSVVQGSIVVARNRLGVEPLTTAGSCVRAYLTASGTGICDGTVVRDGGFAPGLDADAVDVRGDVVWVSGKTSMNISRWRDSPAGLVQEPSGALALSPRRPEILVASSDGLEAYAATTTDVLRVALSGGALVELSRVPLGTVINPGSGFVSNGHFFVVAEPPTLATVTTRVKVCGYSLANGILTKLSGCEEFTGLPFGTIDGALWIREEGLLRAVHSDDTGKLGTLSVLRTPALATRTFKPIASPILELTSGNGWLAPRQSGGTPFFDRYRSVDPNGVTGGATESAVYFSTSGGTRIFAR